MGINTVKIVFEICVYYIVFWVVYRVLPGRGMEDIGVVGIGLVFWLWCGLVEGEGGLVGGEGGVGCVENGRFYIS